MIRITRQGKTCVTLEGHADSDVYGKDLVCAAVSALVLTLAEAVKQQPGAEVVLSPGNSRIRSGPEAEAAFDCICLGFALLAKKYPDYVRYSRQNACRGGS